MLCIKWHNGSTTWERLADLKESYPIEVAELAVAHKLHKESVFAWWVLYVLARQRQIISAVNRGYHKCTHKYGIKIPKNYHDCLRIDNKNGNTLWQDAICQEMSKVRIAFKILNDEEGIATSNLPRDCMSHDI
jgi:hypothetical protein